MLDNSINADTARIYSEFERRYKEVPAEYYSWRKPANILMHQQTTRTCIPLLDRAGLFPLHGRRVCDIGCGGGPWLLEFIQWGADPEKLAGIDLMPVSADCARRRLPQADIRTGNAAELPWPDGSFDLVTHFLVLMNMFDPELKRKVASEMLRVLKPGGAVLWFEGRVGNPRNPHLKGIRAAEVRSLFPGCKVELTSALLAPPLTRLLAGWAWPMAEMLHSLPFLRTHYAGLIQKPMRNNSSASSVEVDA